MINLIPPHARKQVRIEYWVRSVSVWVLLAAIALFIVGVLFAPTYVLIHSQLSAYEDSYAAAAANDASYKELEASVRIANANAQKLLTGGAVHSYTNILEEVDLITNETIVLEEVRMERTSVGLIEQITLRGVAATRIALVAYQEAIEAHAFFETADLPISNLAKDKDVPFSMTVTLKLPETDV